jgi:hypothetical protein
MFLPQLFCSRAAAAAVKLLLALASTVIPGSESFGTHGHILLSHDTWSRATQTLEELIAYFPSIRHGPHRKRRIQKSFYCCVCIRCRANVFTESLPSNHMDGYTHRQQVDIVSLIVLFKIGKVDNNHKNIN